MHPLHCGRMHLHKHLPSVRGVVSGRRCVPRAAGDPSVSSVASPLEVEPPREVSTSQSQTSAQSEYGRVDPAKNDLLMQATAAFLREELPRIFTTGEVTRSKYAADIVFQDPITSYSNLDGYSFNIALLTGLFNIRFELFDVAVTGSSTIEARWSMDMQMKLLPFLPWKPSAIFTGTTAYGVDPNSGLITSHTDYWDACKNNKFLSLEALRYVVQSFTQVRLTPDLETPDYVVLFKTPSYEIRRYDSYTVAEVGMREGAGPAGGAGFTDLAGYIFGGNNEGVSMEMTTPVYSTAGQTGPDANKMQFVMERRFAKENKLPEPKSDKIASKVQPECIRAAYTFSGFPLDFEVFQAEKALRAALQDDGIAASPEYVLARYNEPTAPPFLRRNEILINLPDYKLPLLTST